MITESYFNLTFDKIENNKAICHVNETDEIREFDLNLFDESQRINGNKFTAVIKIKPGTMSIKVEPIN